jgi:hypothetical protein
VALLANLALFFIFFLPLTLLVAIPFDLYVGRYQPAEEASQLFLWMIIGWPLLFPSVLFVPAAHVALAIARRFGWSPDRGTLRMLAVVILPLGLLWFHLWTWGTVVLGAPLLLTFLVPGALMGWVVRIPAWRRSRSVAVEELSHER